MCERNMGRPSFHTWADPHFIIRITRLRIAKAMLFTLKPLEVQHQPSVAGALIEDNF